MISKRFLNATVFRPWPCRTKHCPPQTARHCGLGIANRGSCYRMSGRIYLRICNGNGQSSYESRGGEGTALTISCDENSVDLIQTFAAILQRFRSVVRPSQWRLLIQKHIKFRPYSVARMVRCEPLEPLDERAESISQKGELIRQRIVPQQIRRAL